MSDSDGQGRRGVESDPTDASPVRRRSFLRVTGASAVAATLAGCSSDGDGNGNGNGNGTVETDTRSTGEPFELSEPLSVGLLVSDDLGQPIVRGAELAVEEINEAGGIGGVDVELTTKDMEANADEARSTHRSITGEGGVDATLGLDLPRYLRGAFESIASRETVHLTVGTGRTVNREFGENEYWFRVGPVNWVYQARALAQFIAEGAEDYGWQRVAVLTENLGGYDAVHERLVGALGETVEVPVAKRVGGVAEWSPIFDEIEQQGCDAVLPQFKFIGTKPLNQWRNQERQFGFGGNLPVSMVNRFQHNYGKSGGPFGQTTATATTAVTDKTVPFAEAYQDAYDQAPRSMAFPAYDAVYVLKRAIERAETVDSDALVSVLEEVSYTGTTGTIEFAGLDSDFPHDVEYGPEKVQPLYLQWQDGDDGPEKRVIWPDDLQEGDYKSPPWT